MYTSQPKEACLLWKRTATLTGHSIVQTTSGVYFALPSVILDESPGTSQLELRMYECSQTRPLSLGSQASGFLPLEEPLQLSVEYPAHLVP